MSKLYALASSQYSLNSTAGLITNANNFSVSMWFKPTTNAGTQFMFGIGNSGAFEGAYIAMVGTNSLWAGSFGSGAGNAAMSPASTITPGNWYHVGGVWSPAMQRRRVYFNGTNTLDTTVVNPTGINRASLGALFWNGAPSASFFDGALAHVGLWDTELTDGEMESLAAGCSPKKIRIGALADYWPLMQPGADGNGARGNLMAGVNAPTAVADNPRTYH